MDLQTYVNAIEKIHSDPLSFLFSSHAEKRERQLSKFHAAVEHRLQSDKRVCTCKSHGSEYLKDDVWRCGYCKLPLAAKA